MLIGVASRVPPHAGSPKPDTFLKSFDRETAQELAGLCADGDTFRSRVLLANIWQYVTLSRFAGKHLAIRGALVVCWLTFGMIEPPHGVIQTGHFSQRI